MAELRLVVGGIEMGESPRWHDGRLWFCDWIAHEVRAVDLHGRVEVIATVDALPFSIDWLADGTLLVVAGTEVLRQGPDGRLTRHADLSALCPYPWNEIVVDGADRIWVDDIGYDFTGGGEPGPGIVAVVTPDGEVRQVAGDVLFPNGMAVTADGATLIVAESHGHRLTAFDIADDATLTNRRVWAELGPGAAPDGICIDADGAIWWAEVPGQRCVRTAEGGAVLRTVEADRGCFACMLGGPDGSTLFVVANAWGGVEAGASAGVIYATDAPAPAAGWPASR